VAAAIIITMIIAGSSNEKSSGRSESIYCIIHSGRIIASSEACIYYFSSILSGEIYSLNDIFQRHTSISYPYGHDSCIEIYSEYSFSVIRFSGNSSGDMRSMV
jgi:hypothetical protein